MVWFVAFIIWLMGMVTPTGQVGPEDDPVTVECTIFEDGSVPRGCPPPPPGWEWDCTSMGNRICG